MTLASVEACDTTRHASPELRQAAALGTQNGRMIPLFDASIDASIPAKASLWVPDGRDPAWRSRYFQDVWTIEHVTRGEAQAVIASEAIAIDYLDGRAIDAVDFDSLAGDIEYEAPDCPSDGAPEFMHDPAVAWTGLERLEVGVAGLSYALASLGLLPTASCRGHHAAPSWSPYPIVIFAATRTQVERVEPLVRAAGCGFVLDDERRGLIGINARSIANLSQLAAALLAEG